MLYIINFLLHLIYFILLGNKNFQIPKTNLLHAQIWGGTKNI